jgi:hypothetical protein
MRASMYGIPETVVANEALMRAPPLRARRLPNPTAVKFSAARLRDRIHGTGRFVIVHVRAPQCPGGAADFDIVASAEWRHQFDGDRLTVGPVNS